MLIRSLLKLKKSQRKPNLLLLMPINPLLKLSKSISAPEKFAADVEKTIANNKLAADAAVKAVALANKAVDDIKQTTKNVNDVINKAQQVTDTAQQAAKDVKLAFDAAQKTFEEKAVIKAR